MYYMGIDPGYSGAIAIIDKDGSFRCSMRLSDTEHDVADFVEEFSHNTTLAVLERVSAMPRQGVSSTFKFGTSYGFCRGLRVSVAGCRWPSRSSSTGAGAFSRDRFRFAISAPLPDSFPC